MHCSKSISFFYNLCFSIRNFILRPLQVFWESLAGCSQDTGAFIHIISNYVHDRPFSHANHIFSFLWKKKNMILICAAAPCFSISAAPCFIISFFLLLWTVSVLKFTVISTIYCSCFFSHSRLLDSEFLTSRNCVKTKIFNCTLTREASLQLEGAGFYPV